MELDEAKEAAQPLVHSLDIMINNRIERSEVIKILGFVVKEIRRDIKDHVYDTGKLSKSVHYRLYKLGRDGEMYRATVFIDEQSAPYAKFVLEGFWDGGRGKINYSVPPRLWHWAYNHVAFGLEAFAYTDNWWARQRAYVDNNLVKKGQALSAAWIGEGSSYQRMSKKKREVKGSVYEKAFPRSGQVVDWKKTNVRSFRRMVGLGKVFKDPFMGTKDKSMQILNLASKGKIEHPLRYDLFDIAPAVRAKVDEIARAIWITIQKRGFRGWDFWTPHTNDMDKWLRAYRFKTPKARNWRRLAIQAGLFGVAGSTDIARQEMMNNVGQIDKILQDTYLKGELVNTDRLLNNPMTENMLDELRKYRDSRVATAPDYIVKLKAALAQRK